MTEANIRSRGWDGMCTFLMKEPVSRKRILAFCACCRCVWDHVKLECNRHALVTSERFADGEVTKEELLTSWRAVRFEPSVYAEWFLSAAGPAEGEFARRANPTNDERGLLEERLTSRTYDPHSELSRQRVAIGFDVFGHRFLKADFDSSWRTEAAVALARGMYESRDFAAMAVLADALDDAGCADADILAHCRGAGPHVRGCWVVDLVLGKE